MKKAAFKPHISTEKNIKEFSLKALILGLILGFLFVIGNAYLGLKTGTTVTASIPAAILSMTFLRIFFKRVTILENNIVQTIATVGEGMASGVIFTIPALIFLGADPSINKIFLLSTLGGLLGILFMIPMRRYIIVEEHETLPFPEGKACAEILKAGESSSHSAALLALLGFLTAVGFKICTSIFYLWEEIPKWIIRPLKRTEFSLDATPALLGVGYIVGLRMTSIMFAGGIFSWWILIPLIRTFGGSDLIIYPSEIPVSQMDTQAIWSTYIRYIGAGAVAIAGFLSLYRILPLLFKTFHLGVKNLFSNTSAEEIQRTDRDISLSWLILGSISIILSLWLIPVLSFNLLGILIIIILGFFFVAVTSITVGIVGSSSNPASGMTLTTLLVTCLIFVSIGWTEKVYLITAMSVGCVANVAITMAATTSQDLKTGYLLGATPKSQQIAEIIGILIPSASLGFTIFILNKAYGLGSMQLPAPQATLMAMIAEGILNQNLPFILILIGIILGLIAFILKIPLLPFAMGLYLPLSLTSAMLTGGIISWILDHHAEGKNKSRKALLISSGLIGGDAFAGVIIALLTIFNILPLKPSPLLPNFFSLLFFFLLGFFLIFFSAKKVFFRK